MYMYINKLQT